MNNQDTNPGKILHNRYRIDELLGKGGLGNVYKGYDLLIERDVAVKILNIEKFGDSEKERLLSEARLAGKLNHPNIVQIFDAGETESTYYIIMELLKGQSLLGYRPATIQETIGIVHQICQALAHAHQHGIIHRDLKPENIILEDSGIIKLTDFGLAQSVASRLSQGNLIVGTAFYLAPEMALGEKVDERTDLYSLGIIFYELLTGKLPFHNGDSLTIISQHIYATPASMRTTNPEIPEELDELVLKLLKKNRMERPQQAGDVLEFISNFNSSGRMTVANQPFDLLERIVRGKLVGRKVEYSQLMTFWNHTLQGEARTLLVTGEPGVGKTRLVREFTAQVALTGGQIVSGECYAEGGTPYEPISQMIQSVSTDTGMPDLQLPDYVISNLLTLSPRLVSFFPGHIPAKMSEGDVEQSLLFESFSLWCSALAQKAPVLIFLDDAHWADSGTLYLLRYLIRRVKNLPIGIVFAYREADVEPAGPLQYILHDLNRERLTTRIKLNRLNLDETGAMIQSILIPQGAIQPQIIETIFRETEGNPFFIEELCKSLVEDGHLIFSNKTWIIPDISSIFIPQSIRLTIQARLSRLPAQTQEILRVASVFGREFDFDVLKLATNVQEEELIEGLEMAERMQIISQVSKPMDVNSRFAFAHALIPASLRDTINSLRRQRFYRKAASAIEQVHPEDFESLAFHYAQAGDAEKARTNFLLAGERALSIYAFQEAKRYFLSALDLCRTEAGHALILSNLGEAYFGENSFDLAEKAWLDAIQYEISLHDYDKVAHLYARAARAAWFANEYQKSLNLCRQGMSLIPANSETRGRAELLHETARACYFNDLVSEAGQLCQDALQTAEKLSLLDVQADTLATIGILPDQSPEVAENSLLRSIEIAEKIKAHPIASRGCINLSNHYKNWGQFGLSRDIARKGLNNSIQSGSIPLQFSNQMMIAFTTLMMGEYEAVQDITPKLEFLVSNHPGQANARMHVDLLISSLLFQQGLVNEAIQSIRRLKAEAQTQNNQVLLVEIDINLAEYLIDQKYFEEAETIIKNLTDQAHQNHDTDPVYLFTLLALALVGQGKLDEAEQLIKRAEDLANPFPTPVDRCRIQWAKLTYLGEQKQFEAAVTLGEQLILEVNELELPFFQAGIHLDYGNILQVSQKPGDLEIALIHFQQSLSIYERLPANPRAEIVQQKINRLEQIIQRN